MFVCLGVGRLGGVDVVSRELGRAVPACLAHLGIDSSTVLLFLLSCGESLGSGWLSGGFLELVGFGSKNLCS